MRLERVTVVHAVEIDGSHAETLYASKGAKGLCWEAGLVWFTDSNGKHAVPASNVRRMTVAKDEKK